MPIGSHKKHGTTFSGNPVCASHTYNAPNDQEKSPKETEGEEYSAASRNFEKGARSRRHFQKVGQPEYFWATHPFNEKHPFNIYLCIIILQEAFISIITNFLFLKNTFKIQKNYYNRFLPFLLSREKKS